MIKYKQHRYIAIRTILEILCMTFLQFIGGKKNVHNITYIWQFWYFSPGHLYWGEKSTPKKTLHNIRCIEQFWSVLSGKKLHWEKTCTQHKIYRTILVFFAWSSLYGFQSPATGFKPAAYRTTNTGGAWAPTETASFSIAFSGRTP